MTDHPGLDPARVRDPEREPAHEIEGDEGEFLLRSIADLDREHAAGDIADDDHRALRDAYVARAAGVLKGEVAPTRRPSSRNRRLAVATSTMVVAVGAGLAVARSSGERLRGDEITGGRPRSPVNTTASPVPPVAGNATTLSPGAPRRSQQTAGEPATAEVADLLERARGAMVDDKVGALRLFDQALSIDPRNVEALTYGAWIIRLAGTQSGNTTLTAKAKERLDRALSISPDYPDALAFRGILSLRDLGAPAAALADFRRLEALNPPEQIKALVGPALAEAVSLLEPPATSTP